VSSPPAGALDYRWDLDGSGRFATDSRLLPKLTTTALAPGVDRVSVRVAVGRSLSLGKLALVVRPAAVVSGAAAVRAHAAATTSVTIVDYKYAPTITTVHVGDTIRWTNSGQAPHTATANNGSFDTGILPKGGSGSHTFATAGTFTYYCTVHPFMHGKVNVLATSSSTTTGSHTTSTTTTTGTHSTTAPSATTTGSTATSTTTGSTATGTSGSGLPHTGVDLILLIAFGAVMLAVGYGIQRAIRTH
jgi:plastocyanin